MNIRGLNAKVRQLGLDIVHSLEVASLQTFKLAALKPFERFKLFTETHQTLSVMRPSMRQDNGEHFKRASYRLTRTLPSYLASLTIEACYAVTPDCYEVARRFYGCTVSNLKLLSLGADTHTFHPVETGRGRVETGASSTPRIHRRRHRLRLHRTFHE